MDDDAHTPSPYAQIRLLQRLVKSQAEQLEAFRQRELARARAQEIVWEAGTSPPSLSPTPPPPRRRHKRDRPPWLHVVKGVFGAGAAWVAAKRIRQVLAAGTAVAAVTTGAVTPSVISPGSPAHAGPSPVSVRHHHEPTAGRPQPQPSRKKRQPSGRTHRFTPGGTPAPAGSPQGGGTPAPTPAVSPPLPVPSPLPTPAPSETPDVCLPPPVCDQLDQCCDQDGNTQHPLLGAVTQTRAWLIAKHRLRLAA